MVLAPAVVEDSATELATEELPPPLDADADGLDEPPETLDPDTGSTTEEPAPEAVDARLEELPTETLLALKLDVAGTVTW